MFFFFKMTSLSSNEKLNGEQSLIMCNVEIIYLSSYQTFPCNLSRIREGWSLVQYSPASPNSGTGPHRPLHSEKASTARSALCCHLSHCMEQGRCEQNHLVCLRMYPYLIFTQNWVGRIIIFASPFSILMN